MNGCRGFHHKAVKAQSAGGHFNGGVNIVRSRLCRLGKQHVANALKGVDGGFLQTPSQNAFLVFSEHL